MILWVCTKNKNSGLYHYSKRLLKNFKEDEILWIEEEVENFKDYIKIYNLGNHKMNSKIYKLAYDFPSYVLLHDLNLHHAALDLNDDKYFERKNLAFSLRKSGLWIDSFELYLPAISEILKKQKGIFVHSKYGIEVLKIYGIKNEIYYIPMGTEIPEKNFEKIPYSIGIFGHRGINRNLKETAKMILNLKKKFPQMKLIICGGGMKEGLDELDFAEYYENLEDEKFYELLSRVEILFNFRYPVYGETSLSTLEAMARGVVPVVSVYGSYNEIEGAIKVRKINDAYYEIKNLWENREKLKKLSEEAANFIKNKHSDQIWEKEWKKAIYGLKK